MLRRAANFFLKYFNIQSDTYLAQSVGGRRRVCLLISAHVTLVRFITYLSSALKTNITQLGWELYAAEKWSKFVAASHTRNKRATQLFYTLIFNKGISTQMHIITFSDRPFVL